MRHDAPKEPVDIRFVVDWSRRWTRGWNEHDVDALLSMCSDDIVWDDPALPETVYGHAGVRGFLEAMFQTFPDVTVTGEGKIFLTIGPHALAPYRLTGTMKADWAPRRLSATGRRVEYRGIDEWEFRDGLLCRYDTHYDSLDAVRQLGLLGQLARQ